jgi:hypothetical protein
VQGMRNLAERNFGMLGDEDVICSYVGLLSCDRDASYDEMKYGLIKFFWIWNVERVFNIGGSWIRLGLKFNGLWIHSCVYLNLKII